MDRPLLSLRGQLSFIAEWTPEMVETILVNNQLDALFSMYLFISLLYMFRATQCSSRGESNCINTSSGIYHSV